MEVFELDLTTEVVGVRALTSIFIGLVLLVPSYTAS